MLHDLTLFTDGAGTPEEVESQLTVRFQYLQILRVCGGIPTGVLIRLVAPALEELHIKALYIVHPLLFCGIVLSYFVSTFMHISLRLSLLKSHIGQKPSTCLWRNAPGLRHSTYPNGWKRNARNLLVAVTLFSIRRWVFSAASPYFSFLDLSPFVPLCHFCSSPSPISTHNLNRLDVKL